MMDSKALAVIKRHTKVDPETGCWNWISSTMEEGYGQLTFEGKHYTAHRFTYSRLVEPIDGDNWVLHHCDNRRCVNPDHLYQGTPTDNRRDMLVRERWQHPSASNSACAAGHTYTEGSFRIAKDGSRVCRECMKQHMRKYRAKLKGEVK